jgi:hypothetical protein
MPGGLFSLAKLFGVTLRESANDGSDFTNPDADYRRLFLGEDGLLHLRDSAGVVTTPHAGSGAVNGSGLTMATARLLGRSTASTGAIEEITVGSGLSLAAGALTATGGGGGSLDDLSDVEVGTSFPGGPATNDLCWRTDRGLLYYYDGTRWLTVQKLHQTMAFIAETAEALPFTTTHSPFRLVHPTGGEFDIWMVDFIWMSRVATTNDGTKFWVATLSKFDTAASMTTIVAPDTSADTAGQFVKHRTTIGALLGTSPTGLDLTMTKTSTPGNLTMLNAMLSYRLVG